MSRKIYKYVIDVPSLPTESIELPVDAEILTAQFQYFNNLVLWAIVSTDAPLKRFKIRTFFTGEEIPENLKLRYISTAQKASLVYHIFHELD